jgi:uncharacterized YigZ family protein
MDRIKKPTQAILEIKRSVFTADVVSMTDETLIKPYIESLKALYPKSAHITYAAFLNEGAYQKYSDDNEPKGTAGLPILEAIKYYDVTDIILTVRRDFGGILLGASGLIRAYREAAHEALKKIERLKKKTTLSVSFRLDYKDYELLKNTLNDWFYELELDFEEKVDLKGFILEEHLNDFTHFLEQRFHQKIPLNLGPKTIKYLADE